MQIVQILRIIEKCLVFYSSLYAPDNGEFSGHLPQILKMQPKVKKPFSQSTNRLERDLSSQSKSILIRMEQLRAMNLQK
jgi:hypothetical protein